MQRQGMAVEPSGSTPVTRSQTGEVAGTTGIGIDIEEVAALPRVADLRKETFYTQNFTPGEIAYCILQADPYTSLTGLFAVKEAIIKADGQYRNRPFHTMEIGHTAEGRPVFPGMGLSISHAGGMAVAVAVAERAPVVPIAPPAAARPASTAWITWIALLLAAAALLVALKH
jgi:phosphopantetheine--protein transferase-like protein